MANLTRKNWSLGWLPSQDRKNGNSQGLLRMDNLTLDEDGCLTLTRGINKVNATEFPNFVTRIFSNEFNNTKIRYVSLANGEVRRGEGDTFSNEQTIISGGNPVVAAFGSMLGANFILSGDERKREFADEVTAQLVTHDITPETPQDAPVINSITQGVVRPLDDGGLYSSFTSIESSAFSAGADNVQFSVDATTFRGVIQLESPIDTKLPDSSQAIATDGFQLAIRIGETNALKSVRVDFILDDVDNPRNYFYRVWENDLATFVQGADAWSIISCRRDDFTREGGDGDFNWSTVVGIKISLVANDTCDNNVITDMRFIGGERGLLHGLYEYIQVNVSNNGSYISRSYRSAITQDVYVSHGYVTIEPQVPTDQQVNEIWFYRRRAEFSEGDAVPVGEVPKLDKFYFACKMVKPPGGSFPATAEDNLSDDDLLDLNDWYDFTWLSLLDYPELIFDMVADHKGRAVYLTPTSIIVSAENDPGLIESRLTLSVGGGDYIQRNLWMHSANVGTSSIIYVGTSEAIFVIQGTLSAFPDGTPDAQIDKIETTSPPLGSEVDENSGVLYYVAGNEIKALSGTNSVSISGQLKLLLEGHTRYGIAGVLMQAGDVAAYPVLVAKGKLWVSLPNKDGTRRLYVYDIAKQYWYPYYTDPIALYRESDGTILAGYGGGSGNFLRLLDNGDDLDGVLGQDIHFETVADDNQQPRNRKDTFTFKLKADAGGETLNLAIAINGSEAYTSIGSTTFGPGPTEKLITIAETIGRAKDYALRITGTNLTTCKIYEFTIEYDPLPEQLTYLRIPNTNLNTVSRKRFINFPFVIDTLGNDTEFIPLIDNQVNGPSSIINHNGKLTHVHYFFPTDPQADEFVGTDIGGILCGFFEFYNVNLEEIASEKLPVPTKFLLIPQTDYGVPNRKRHSSYKFQINTRGQQVRFTPLIDGVWYSPLDFSTSRKQTIEYFFSVDTIGIDIGGTLESLADTPFEFYGVIKPQEVEVLPARLKEFRIPENNYGHAAKKRIRTMPMVINTNGFDVVFTPIVDNVAQTPTTLNTPTRMTTFHYFNSDVFGTDFSGELIGENPFEFYGLMKPEDVEVLPVAKKFDQIGPFRVDRIGRLQRLRLRLITEENEVPIKILTESEATLPNMIGKSGQWTGTFETVPNVDNTWELIVPKTIYGNIFRFEIGPTSSPFHRYDLSILLNQLGNQTSQKWIKVDGIQNSRY